MVWDGGRLGPTEIFLIFTQRKPESNKWEVEKCEPLISIPSGEGPAGGEGSQAPSILSAGWDKEHIFVITIAKMLYIRYDEKGNWSFLIREKAERL